MRDDGRGGLDDFVGPLKAALNRQGEVLREIQTVATNPSLPMPDDGQEKTA
jgi:hypothetical protein